MGIGDSLGIFDLFLSEKNLGDLQSDILKLGIGIINCGYKLFDKSFNMWKSYGFPGKKIYKC